MTSLVREGRRYEYSEWLDFECEGREPSERARELAEEFTKRAVAVATSYLRSQRGPDADPVLAGMKEDAFAWNAYASIVGHGVGLWEEDGDTGLPGEIEGILDEVVKKDKKLRELADEISVECAAGEDEASERRARDYDSADDALAKVYEFLGAEFYTRDGDRITAYIPVDLETGQAYDAVKLFKAHGLFHWPDDGFTRVKKVPEGARPTPHPTFETPRRFRGEESPRGGGPLQAGERVRYRFEGDREWQTCSLASFLRNNRETLDNEEIRAIKSGDLVSLGGGAWQRSQVQLVRDNPQGREPLGAGEKLFPDAASAVRYVWREMSAGTDTGVKRVDASAFDVYVENEHGKLVSHRVYEKTRGAWAIAGRTMFQSAFPEDAPSIGDWLRKHAPKGGREESPQGGEPLAREGWADQFDSTLKVGDRIEARWTWGFESHTAPAEVVKLSKKSLRAALLAPYAYSDKPGYTMPKGHVLVLPRAGAEGWTQNNGAYPPNAPRVGGEPLQEERRSKRYTPGTLTEYTGVVEQELQRWHSADRAHELAIKHKKLIHTLWKAKETAEEAAWEIDHRSQDWRTRADQYRGMYIDYEPGSGMHGGYWVGRAGLKSSQGPFDTKDRAKKWIDRHAREDSPRVGEPFSTRQISGARSNGASRSPPAARESAESTELLLYANNTSELYAQKKAIRENLAKKMKKGTYDPELAAKAWMYWLESAAKRYVKEFGGGSWHAIFPMSSRLEAARELEQQERAEIEIELTRGRQEFGPREARDNPVTDVSDALPWLKISKDPERYQAALKNAAAIGPIDDSKKVFELLGPALLEEDQETFVVVLLDVRQQCRGVAEVHRGSRSRVATSIVDVMRVVIASGAEGFVVVHNHPSGKASPSEADRELTEAIHKAARLFNPDVSFVDHVVIGASEYYSFADKKLHQAKGNHDARSARKSRRRAAEAG